MSRKSALLNPLSSMFDRRSLLQAMGLGTGSLFLPSLLNDKQARAAEAKKNLYIFYTQHGPVYPNWRIRQPGLNDTTADWEIDLKTLPEAEWSEVLRPLYPHRDDLLVVDGAANTVGFLTNGNAHDIANAVALTGAKVIQGGGNGPSVDQIVGKAIAAPGRRQGLYASTWGAWSPVHSGPGKQINGTVEPQQLFDSIIGLATPTTPGVKPPVDKLALARATSLPDLVRDDFKALLAKVSGEDKRKLQDHTDLMDSLQKQLQVSMGMGDGMAPECNLGAGPGGFSAVVQSANASSKILTAALACDITRVAMQVHGQMAAPEFGAPPVKDVHEDIAHAAIPNSPEGALMTKYYNVHAQQFATIVGQMKTLGLLQNSVVAWVTELANGPHDLFRLPIVLAGACGGYFKTGRYLKYAETFPAGQWKVGPAHNKVWVSVMQALGLPNNTLGESSVGGVDISGPLPRLRAGA